MAIALPFSFTKHQRKEPHLASKKVPFSKQGIKNLPNDKPVLYRIETEGGRNNYTGIARKGG